MSECTWAECNDDMCEYHETSCGEAHVFTTGNLADNNYKYCPYCGKKIKAQERGENQ